MKGIYIVPRHSKLIYEGKKKLIIKKKKLPEDLKVGWLVTKEKGQGFKLGKISLSRPKKIFLDEFLKKSDLHLITPKERKAWWGDAKKFFSYTFKFRKLKVPEKIDIPRGVQTIVDMQEKLGTTFHIGQKVKLGPHKDGSCTEGIVLEVQESRVKIKDITLKEEFWISTFSEFPIFPGNESERGEEIDLNQFLSRVKDSYLIEDFVTIVGSIANWRKTTGDIDILIKAPEDSDIFQLMKWRFQRAFPEIANRLHFSEAGQWQGPFTDHVHVFDLKAEISANFQEIHNMSKIPGFEKSANTSKKEDRVEPMRPCFLLKPMHGRQKEEQYSPDSVLKVMNSKWETWEDIGVYLERKFDGVHCSIHKKGNDVLILSEDGRDYTTNCPTMASEIKDINSNFVVAGEIELWKDNQHQPRADAAGVLNSKLPHEDEKDLRINLFDILYYS